jgi:hypothetical protein
MSRRAASLVDCEQYQFDSSWAAIQTCSPKLLRRGALGLVFQPTTSSTVSVDYWNYIVKQSISHTRRRRHVQRPDGLCQQLRALQPGQSASERADRFVQRTRRRPLGLHRQHLRESGHLQDQRASTSAAAWSSQSYSYGRFSAGLAGHLCCSSTNTSSKPGGVYNNNLGMYFNGQPISSFRQVLVLGWQQGDWTSAQAEWRHRAGSPRH